MQFFYFCIINSEINHTGSSQNSWKATAWSEEIAPISPVTARKATATKERKTLIILIIILLFVI